MKPNPNIRIGVLALSIFLLDQATKLTVLKFLAYADEKIIVHGFFKFVHLGNTGAAWSMFYGNNRGLAVVALAALVVLYLIRHHFELHTRTGQISLGLIFGGIVGNLTDRLVHKHVIDFVYFYVIRRNGDEAGFPAFNVADTAICIGVGLLFLLSWQNESKGTDAAAPDSSRS